MHIPGPQDPKASNARRAAAQTPPIGAQEEAHVQAQDGRGRIRKTARPEEEGIQGN